MLSIFGRLLNYIIVAFFCYFLFVFFKLAMVFPWLPQQLYFAQSPEKSDVIVFLDGEYKERVLYAFELYEQGYARKMFSPNIEVYANKRIVKQKKKLLGSKLNLFQGGKASSTYEEALITREFVNKNHLKSLLLVTSPYHSYRAYWTFKKTMPDVRILSTPVPLDRSWFKFDRATIDDDHKRIVRNEQLKFLGYYLRYNFGINVDKETQQEIKAKLSTKEDVDYIYYLKKILNDEIHK